MTKILKTPLKRIKTLARFLGGKQTKESSKDTDVQVHEYDTIQYEVNEILDLQKLKSKKLQHKLIRANVVMFIKNIIDSHQYLAIEKQIKMQLEHEEEEIYMDFDFNKLRITISGLIYNVIELTPKGGKVVMTIKHDKKSIALILNVKDSGIDKTDDELLNRFKLFHNSDTSVLNQQKDSGVALYFCKTLIKSMKGQIDKPNNNRAGTRLKVTLPVYRKSKQNSFKNDNSVYKPSAKDNSSIEFIEPKKNHTLLIVDDNPAVRKLLEIQFIPIYNLIIAHDSQDGINKAITHSPDVIICDDMLPGKNCDDLCQTLKADIHTSHIPIILIKANLDHESKIKALELKADIFLTKPFDQEELELHIKNLIDGRKKHQEFHKNFTGNISSTPQPKEDIFITNLRKIISDNIKDPDFDYKDICVSMKISRSNLHNKIKAHTGLSITNYINHLKLHKAKTLLETSQLNISEVSFEVGILNYSYFYKLFKKEFGVSPKQYRDSFMN